MRRQSSHSDRTEVRNGQRKQKGKQKKSHKPSNRTSKVVSLDVHRRKRARLSDMFRAGLQGNGRPWWVRAFAVIAVVAMLGYMVTLFLPSFGR